MICYSTIKSLYFAMSSIVLRAARAILDDDIALLSQLLKDDDVDWNHATAEACFDGTSGLFVRLGLRKSTESALVRHLNILSLAVSMQASDALVRIVQLLVESNRFDANAALYLAAQCGNVNIVELLLSAVDQIDVNKTVAWGESPLYAAVRQRHVDVVRALLAADGIDVNRADKDGYTPLFVAARNGVNAIVRLLLSADGIDVNQASSYSRSTPLHIAVNQGRKEAVRLLLAAVGIDAGGADHYGVIPLRLAAQLGKRDIATILAMEHSVLEFYERGSAAAPAAKVAQASQVQVLHNMAVRKAQRSLLLRCYEMLERDDQRAALPQPTVDYINRQQQALELSASDLLLFCYDHT
jgi:Ankyrin repeats (3 copies)/Ankyrin repeat